MGDPLRQAAVRVEPDISLHVAAWAVAASVLPRRPVTVNGVELPPRPDLGAGKDVVEALLADPRFLALAVRAASSGIIREGTYLAGEAWCIAQVRPDVAAVLEGGQG